MLVLIGEFGLDPCSNEFATAKQSFKILKWSLLLNLGFFTFQKQDVSLHKIQFLVSRTGKDCFTVNLSSFVCLEIFQPECNCYKIVREPLLVIRLKH